MPCSITPPGRFRIWTTTRIWTFVNFSQWRKYFSIKSDSYDGEKFYEIVNCKAQNSTIRIPAGIEGVEVWSLKRKSFYNLADSVKEIVVPKTIKFIDNYVFGNCKGLERVVIDGKCNIQRYAFYNCPNLKEVILEGENVMKEEWKTEKHWW